MIDPSQLPLLIIAGSVAVILGIVVNLLILFAVIRAAVISAHRKLRTETRNGVRA